jgi:hypothetical protein
MHTHTAYLRRLDTGGMRVFASAVDANTHTHAAMSARQCNAENDMASCSGVYYLLQKQLQLASSSKRHGTECGIDASSKTFLSFLLLKLENDG